MSRGFLFASAAALAALVVGNRAIAETPANSQNPAIYAQDATPAAAAPDKPLTALADKAGLGDTLKSEGLTIGGWAEGSWTYNFNNPGSHTNVGRVFDFEDQDLTLNQVALYVDRKVDASNGKFDVGFRVEGMYGADGRLIHSNGLDFYGPGDASNGGQQYPQNQADLTQAYVTMAIPVGSGLTLKLGKFVTPMGYETINPTNNQLFSHSYLFGYAIPFTQTGAIASYNINSALSVYGGFTRGWDQSTKDNNDAIDFLGGGSYVINDKWSASLNLSVGPQHVNNTSDYRTVIDLVVSYKAADNLTLALNADYGYDSNGAADGNTGQWNGVALYAGYVIDPRFTLNGRIEYFNDHDGARGFGTNLYEGTVGVTCKPFPDNEWASGLSIRPEVRWDYSPESIFDSGDNNNQFTFGVDAVYAF